MIGHLPEWSKGFDSSDSSFDTSFPALWGWSIQIDSFLQRFESASGHIVFFAAGAGGKGDPAQ